MFKGILPKKKIKNFLNNNEKTSASRGEPVFIEGKITLSGQHLMSNGVTLPCQFPDRIWVLEGALSTS